MNKKKFEIYLEFNYSSLNFAVFNKIKKNEELNKKKIIDLRIGNNIILSNE